MALLKLVIEVQLAWQGPRDESLHRPLPPAARRVAHLFENAYLRAEELFAQRAGHEPLAALAHAAVALIRGLLSFSKASVPLTPGAPGGNFPGPGLRHLCFFLDCILFLFLSYFNEL